MSLQSAVEVAEAAEVEEAVVKGPETEEAPAELKVSGVHAMLTYPPPRPVICIGNLGRVPGGVGTDTAVHGETTKVPNHDTIETSWVKLKWKSSNERMTSLTK